MEDIDYDNRQDFDPQESNAWDMDMDGMDIC